MTICYLGLGSNLDEPLRQVEQAIAQLAARVDCQLLATSSCYRSAPIGPQDQPDFINAVVALDTSLAPLSLLDVAQALEQHAGRKRLRHWGERTLDVDLLLYGDITLELPRLTLPHPQLTQRAFVLLPLAEIAPELILPDGSKVTERLAADAIACQSLVRL